MPRFSRLLRKSQNLMPGKFNRTGFVDIDVAGFRRKGTFKRLQQGVYHKLVCLRAPINKVDRRIRVLTGLPNLFHRQCRKAIASIAGRLLHVGLAEGFQNLFMAAFQVIAGK